MDNNNINESVNKQDDVIICDDCGQVIIDEDMAYTTADGRTICESCYEENYCVCDICGEVHRLEEMIYIQNIGTYLCEDCADKHGYKCMDCGNWYSVGNGVIDINGDFVCESCLSNWVICKCCGQLIPLEEALDFGDGFSYCQHCYDELDLQGIYAYHDFVDFKPMMTDNEVDNIDTNELELIGLEIEVDTTGNKTTQEDVDNVLNSLDNNAVLMRDSSLVNGFEIVTNPMTKEYVYNNFKCSITNTMNYLKSTNKYKCYNKGGIHIHVSKNMISFETSAILHGLLNKQYQYFWLIITQRHETQLNKWAKLYPCDDERYQALNHDYRTGTYEFRIFNSSLRIDRIYKNIDVVYSLIDFAKSKNASTNIEDYIAYIMNNRYKYTYLFNFMIEKELVKMEDLLECV